jgi:6-phosphogluconolactonase
MTGAYLSRRAFLAGAAAISASAPLPVRGKQFSRSIEYVGTAESIEVYRTEAAQKRKVQSLVSQHPSSLTLDVIGQYLFAVNEIDNFQGLPTGSVESYRIEPITGQLSLISRVPLSLAATMPRQLALSPDGRFLVVAVHGGGLYNVLPFGSRGEIGAVTQVIKEIGCSINGDRQASAHPHSVVFHPSGKFLFGTDEGADRINVFRVEDGHMTCVQRLATVPGTGPAGLALEARGSHLRVEHAFSTSISRYRFDPRSGLFAS